MPWFVVDDKFSDSKEVLSIPARYRAAAIGLWTLCGSWSMGKLTDGFVPEAIVAHLAGSRYWRGTADRLVEAGLWRYVDGGIQFENWGKWQRTKSEVETRRADAAERKRKSRLEHRDSTQTATTQHADNKQTTSTQQARSTQTTRENVATSTDAEMSQCDPHGRARDSLTQPIPNKEISCDVSSNATDPYGAGISATPGADLVRAVVPKGHPSATLTALRIQASELLRQGAEPDVVRAALQLWCDKPGAGIGRTILSSLYSEAIKTRAAPTPASSRQRPATSDLRVAQAQALKNNPPRLELA